jgi:transcriptional regulator with XRE-family HTH domain
MTIILETPTRRGSVPGLGARIRQARDLHQWSQPDLAAEVGETGGRLDPREVSRWELDLATPGALSLLGLSRALGVSIDWLITGGER